MREGGTCGSGSEGSEAVAIVCCCLAGSVGSLSCFVSFPIHSTCWCFASCSTEPARLPPPPLQRSSTDLPYHPHVFNTARTEDFLPSTMKIDTNDFTTRFEGHAIQGLDCVPLFHAVHSLLLIAPCRCCWQLQKSYHLVPWRNTPRD